MKKSSTKLKFNWRGFQNKVTEFLRFLCGSETDNKVNRSGLWSMISTVSTVVLLIIAYYQFKGINETTAAEFSHKIKNDLYTPKNLQLITLFDDEVLLFKTTGDGEVWFELDTNNYNKLACIENSCSTIPKKYNIFEIDELLQDFEDLSFYEKKGQVNLEYIYDAYAYYIERLWENPEIKKYIKWQRSQPHNSNSYINLENIYKRLKSMTDGEK